MADKKEEIKNAAGSYMRYAGLGFQLAGTIGAGVLLGWYLDKKLNTTKPYFTLACSFVFLLIAMYLGFRDFLKPRE